jgi:hypothetical protein
MDLDRKFSQGIPIGNDISFLLGEIVLAAVDKELPSDPARTFRYFDDYEFACQSESEASRLLESLESELAKFRLRLNPRKTEIVKLPLPAQDEWQDSILNKSRLGLKTERDFIRFFDVAFRLRLENPHAPVLSFALGVLFGVSHPDPKAGSIAESAISQTLLCEPGSCQKALALISYWKLNGFRINTSLFSSTISSLITQSVSKGTHDLAWALSFCVDNGICLDESASTRLKEVNNDIIAILALHLQRKRLLDRSFDRRSLSQRMRGADLDREHWLLCYEGARHNLLTPPRTLVQNNTLFSSMMNAGVSFYEMKMPAHSFVVSQGSAPNWLVRSWIQRAKEPKAGVQIPASLRRAIQTAFLENAGASLSTSEFRAFLSLNGPVEEALTDGEATEYL